MPRIVQYHEEGITVEGKKGFSKDHAVATIDVIIADVRDPGYHVHFVMLENGRVIHNERTPNHK